MGPPDQPNHRQRNCRSADCRNEFFVDTAMVLSCFGPGAEQLTNTGVQANARRASFSYRVDYRTAAALFPR